MRYFLIFVIFTILSCNTIKKGRSTLSGEKFPLNKFPANKKIIAIPEYALSDTYNFLYSQGTTAGGTELQVFGLVGAFEEGAQVKLDFSNTCPQTQGTTIEAESVEFINSSYLKIITPRGYEGAISISVDNPTKEDICQMSAYTYKTLAFTTNQITQDISILDTVENKLFSSKSRIPFGSPASQVGMAYSKRIGEVGRKLYIPDLRYGNLHIYDISNLRYLSSINLQGVEPQLYGTASDIAIDFNGEYGYVSHITSGTDRFKEPIKITNPTPGGISVVDLINNQVIDIDGNPDTTSEGAPEGITRIHNYINGEEMKYYPMSLETIKLEKEKMEYNTNEKYPGEYLFVSGLGEVIFVEQENLDPCPYGEMCEFKRILFPRQVRVEVIDLNPWKVLVPCEGEDCSNWQLGENPDLWKVIKVFGIGQDGIFLPFESRGIAYVGEEPRHEVYATNPHNNMLSRFLYLQTGDPGNPYEWEYISENIPTGTDPTDVKVQEVLTQTGYQTYAYITNAGDDSVTVLDTGTNTEIPFYSPIYQDICYSSDNYPTSFDTRNTGDKGYSSNYNSNTVSVFDLPNNICYSPSNSDGAIDVGEAPIRLIVQPVPTASEVFGIVRDALSFAGPDDFTTQSKQAILIKDWEKVHQLQETNANPQAVLSNIDNFQKNVKKWVVKNELKKNITENVNLYRAGYILDHPGVK